MKTTTTTNTTTTRKPVKRLTATKAQAKKPSKKQAASADLSDASLSPTGRQIAKHAAKATKEKVAKATSKPKAGRQDKPLRIDTGFVALIRKLLKGGKHTISAMAEEVKEQFPDKEIESIKRIGHNLAKRERKADPNTTVRWLPGAAMNTGYMARIDALLREGNLTTRQIGETVAAEFEKDVVSAKKVVRARFKRLRDAEGWDKFSVPSEADIKPAKEAKPKAAKKPAKTAKKAKKVPEQKAPKKIKKVAGGSHEEAPNMARD